MATAKPSVNVTPTKKTSHLSVFDSGNSFDARTTIIVEDRHAAPAHQQLSWIALNLLTAGAANYLTFRLTSTSVITAPVPITGTLTITTARPYTQTTIDVVYAEDDDSVVVKDRKHKKKRKRHKKKS
jgi:hypothetical protein